MWEVSTEQDLTYGNRQSVLAAGIDLLLLLSLLFNGAGTEYYKAINCHQINISFQYNPVGLFKLTE